MVESLVIKSHPKIGSAKTILFAVILCCPLLTTAKDFLPTIFWDKTSPTLNPQHWSKVVNVRIFDHLIFLCPTNLINIVPSSSFDTKSYFNLYVRELEPSDTQLNYSTICDPKHSRYIFSCNQTRTASPDGSNDFSKRIRKFEINTNQALKVDPKFKQGKDYIFFSTSNGQKESLITASTRCTMVFRIHFCTDNETCPLSLCSTYGREDVCKMNSSSKQSISTPKDVHITDNTTSSLTVAWTVLNPGTNVNYYTICYRTNSSQNCSTKLVAAHIRSAILDNLNSSTVYRIRIRAHTCKGPGDYSKEISQKTQTIPQEPVRTTKVPEPSRTSTSEAPIDTIVSEPRSVTVSDISTSSMKISWQRPDIVNADIIYYKICYMKTDEEQVCSTTLITEPDKRSAVLSCLRASTTYGIRVMANTIKGAGNYSEEIRRNTTADSEPVTRAQTGCSKSNIHGVSLVVGLVIGFFAALVIAAIVWIITSKRRKLTDKAPVRHATNRAYKTSVSTMDTINRNLVNGKTGNTIHTIELSAMTGNVD